MTLAPYIDHTILKPTTTLGEVEKYCAEACEYGFAAVRTSLQALRQSVGDKGIGFRLAKLFFRAANVTPPLKRLVFANFGED